MVEGAYELRDASNDLLDEAETLLVDALKLPPVRDFEARSLSLDAFGVKLSRMEYRLDASYYVPAADRITEHLRRHAGELTMIGDSRVSKDVVLPGRFKRVYVEEGRGRVFIGGKQLGQLDPYGKKYLSNVHHGDRISKQLELHENDVLVTCSGTIGKVAMVGRHWDGWAASQHIIRVVPANPDIAGYLYLFLSTGYARMLIARNTYGSVIDEVDDRQIRGVPFPLLQDASVQRRINDLVLEANRKRYEAYELEREAIRIMNDEVVFAK